MDADALGSAMKGQQAVINSAGNASKDSGEAYHSLFKCKNFAASMPGRHDCISADNISTHGGCQAASPRCLQLHCWLRLFFHAVMSVLYSGNSCAPHQDLCSCSDRTSACCTNHYAC